MTYHIIMGSLEIKLGLVLSPETFQVKGEPQNIESPFSTLEHSIFGGYFKKDFLHSSMP